LIGPREGERIWERHIENCLPITTLFSRGASVADIGAGAGLPGIVIALARPDLKITLIEPLARRCEFLFEVIDELLSPKGSLLAMKGESASAELAQTDLKKVKKSQLHEIKMADIPVSRVVELVKAG